MADIAETKLQKKIGQELQCMSSVEKFTADMRGREFKKNFSEMPAVSFSQDRRPVRAACKNWIQLVIYYLADAPVSPWLFLASTLSVSSCCIVSA